jgi:hypothetical protein
MMPKERDDEWRLISSLPLEDKKLTDLSVARDDTQRTDDDKTKFCIA